MPRSLVAATLVLLPLAVGCNRGGNATITRFPQWDFERYQRLGVLPFQGTDPRAARAAQQAGAQLETLLAQNGQFVVVSQRELKAVLEEQDLSRLADVADPRTVIPAGRIQAAQALVVPSITTFDLQHQRREMREPVYARDPRGRVVVDRFGRPIVVSELVREVFVHEATVAGSVRVIDTATSEIIFAYNSPPISREASQAGAPPSVSAEELAADAAREMATDLYTNVAPIRARVKLKSDMLVVALDFYEGKYDTTGKVPTSVASFLVVVRDLPREADRNAFVVRITPEKGREELFAQEFIWSSGNGPRGQAIEVPVAALLASGGTKFAAKLHSGRDEAPLLTRKFKLETPKGDKHGREGEAAAPPPPQ